MKHNPLIRCGGLALVALALALLPGCANWDGHFCLFGYTTQPNYRFKSVRVPIFKSQVYFDETRQGLEMVLTQAVIRQIELKTLGQIHGGADGKLMHGIVA